MQILIREDTFEIKINNYALARKTASCIHLIIPFHVC